MQHQQLDCWLLVVLWLLLLLPAKVAAEVAVGWLLAYAAGLMVLLLLLLPLSRLLHPCRVLRFR
jgi:hypothetical protein